MQEIEVNHINNLPSLTKKIIPQTIQNLKRAEESRSMIQLLHQKISQKQEIPAMIEIINSLNTYTTTMIKCLFISKEGKKNQNEQISYQNENQSNSDKETKSESDETDKEDRLIMDQLQENINIFILEEAMEKTKMCIFDILMDHGSRLLNLKTENDRVKEETLAYFLSAHGKLGLLIELAPLIVYYKKDDLFSLPRYDDRWRHLYKNSLQYKKLRSDAELINQLKEFEKSIYLANSLCYKVYNIENKPLKQIMALVRSAQYFFFNEEARLLTVKFQTNPDPKAAILVWDVIEQIKMWEVFVSQLLDNIAYHEVIQVDASAYPTLTEEMIDSEIANQTIYQKYNSDPVEKKTPADSNIDTPSPNKIQLRLFCAKKMLKRNYGQLLVIPQSNKKTNFSLFQGVKNIFNFTRNQEEKQTLNQNSTQDEQYSQENSSIQNIKRKESQKGEREVFDEVVFHIHGGGWTSMSSFSHQIYTRRWANILKDVPVFSIDYKLLPENKYPVAIADCFQAYCWILFNAEDYYNIKINKILIAGDSAGANMALSICLLAHKHGIRQPDGLLLCYPAVNLSTDVYTPSFLTSLFDPIVPHTFLKCCVSQYINNKRDPKKDPFLSPILYPNEILKLLPPISMMVGEDDSLHDDTIRFTENLILAGAKNVKTVVYNYMRHGFLNYDYPFGFNSSDAIVDTGNMLVELLDPQYLSSQNSN